MPPVSASLDALTARFPHHNSPQTVSSLCHSQKFSTVFEVQFVRRAAIPVTGGVLVSPSFFCLLNYRIKGFDGGLDLVSWQKQGANRTNGRKVLRMNSEKSSKLDQVGGTVIDLFLMTLSALEDVFNPVHEFAYALLSAKIECLRCVLM